MKSNLHPFDVAIRGGGGLLVLSSPLLELHTYPYNFLGIVPILTAFAGFCPLYAAMKALLP
jgi:hypothetical protein